MSDDEVVLVAAEEQAKIRRKRVQTGKTRIETKVDVSEEIVRETLRGDIIDIERVPMDEVVTELPAVRTEGDVIVIPVVEEVLVVEKRLVLREEVRVRRRPKIEEVEVPVTVRRQRVVVHRNAGSGKEQ